MNGSGSKTIITAISGNAFEHHPHGKHADTGPCLMPPSPSFYSGAGTVEDLADTVVARVLDHPGIAQDMVKPWAL